MTERTLLSPRQLRLALKVSEAAWPATMRLLTQHGLRATSLIRGEPPTPLYDFERAQDVLRRACAPKPKDPEGADEPTDPDADQDTRNSREFAQASEIAKRHGLVTSRDINVRFGHTAVNSSFIAALRYRGLQKDPQHLAGRVSLFDPTDVEEAVQRLKKPPEAVAPWPDWVGTDQDASTVEPEPPASEPAQTNAEYEGITAPAFLVGKVIGGEKVEEADVAELEKELRAAYGLTPIDDRLPARYSIADLRKACRKLARDNC